MTNGTEWSAGHRDDRRRARILWSGGAPVGYLVATVLFAACVQPSVDSSAGLTSGDGGVADGGAAARVTCHYEPSHPHEESPGWVGGEGPARRISVDIGRDHAEYAVQSNPHGDAILFHVSVAGVMDMRIETPSPDHPDEGEASINVVGNGRLDLRSTRDGVLTFAEHRGRPLDLASPSTRYADGSPIDWRLPGGFPPDADQRINTILRELATGMAGCMGAPAVDPPSCPTPATRAIEAGPTVGGDTCLACLGGVGAGLIVCLGAAGGTCAGIASGCGPFSAICAAICILIAFAICAIVAAFSEFACLDGAACCPVRCGEFDSFPRTHASCCRGGSTCVDHNARLCCEVSCGAGVCCPSGNTCATAPDLAGGLACTEATVCCPADHQCGSGCCNGPGMCGDILNGPCCEGAVGGERGPCPGHRDPSGALTNCCEAGTSCADFGVCCMTGTECTGGTCCDPGFACAPLAGPGSCCPAGTTLCADCLLGPTCVAGSCPMRTTGAPPFCPGTPPRPARRP